MLHSRILTNSINNIHESALTLTYKDNKSSFKQLLKRIILWQFITKTYKFQSQKSLKLKKILATAIMKDAFELEEPLYNLRSESNHFTRWNVKTTYYMVFYQLST